MQEDLTRPYIPDRMYFKISEVSKITQVKSYVLRYWETEFEVLAPQKSKAKQRVYERKDIENILLIKKLLWKDRFSIEGARLKIKELRRENRDQQKVLQKSPEIQKLRHVKNELKDLVQYLRTSPT